MGNVLEQVIMIFIISIIIYSYPNKRANETKFVDFYRNRRAEEIFLRNVWFSG